LLVAELAAILKARGQTLLDALDALARTHGLHATDQFSLRVADLGLIPRMMARLREHPPDELGDAEVTGVDDLSIGLDGLPPTEALRYRTADGGRVIVRPSGHRAETQVLPRGRRPGRGGRRYPRRADRCAGTDSATQAPEAARARAAERLLALRRDVSASLGAPTPPPPAPHRHAHPHPT